jgi:hypothetical protein
VKLIKRHRKAGAIFATAAVCLSTLFAAPASADTLTSLTVTPTDPTANTQTTLTFAISSSSATANCIRVHFDDSVAFDGLPAAITLGTPVLTGNATPFTTTEAGDYVQGTNAGGVTLTSMTITQFTASTAGTYYAHIETWGNVDCSTGGVVDEGTVAFAITNNTEVSVTVDPSFTFSVANQASACNGESDYQAGAGTATTVALGSLPVSSGKTGGQLLTVSGNAGGGYNVYLRSTQASQPLRSAGHNWADHGGTYPAGNAREAGEKFGFTFKDNNASGTVDDSDPAANAFIPLGNSNLAVMDATTGSSSGTGCVSYLAQTGAATPAGSYTATIIYTAVPVY